jgi:hypothetical protein
MACVLVHQLLHGYHRGHRLLAGSVDLEPNIGDLVARLSDLSGSLVSDVEFQPYLTGYPLPSGEFYALARTWPDDSAPRAGCVITHTLLIPIQEWGRCFDPYGFVKLLSFPSNTAHLDRYRIVLEYDESQPVKGPQLKLPSKDLLIEFTIRYFGEGIIPLVWFGERYPDDVFWSIVGSIWPRLRMQFACCTFSLQPRTLDGRAFDLMFAPTAVYSRFLKIPRENLLEVSPDGTYSRSTGKYYEPWVEELASTILGGTEARSTVSKELLEFGLKLGQDPTSIRKLFLLKDLRERATESSTAAVGLMDLVESLAPEGNEACDYKEDVVASALQVTKRVSAPNNALKSYFLIAERLGRDAFRNISSKTISKLVDAVACLTADYPEVALSVGEELFLVHPKAFESPFTRGMLEAFRQLASISSEQLTVLRHFPAAASSMIEKEPLIALGYLRGMKAQKSGHIASYDLARWISSLSGTDALNHIRKVLLQEIRSDQEAPIAEELFKHITEEDIYGVLEALSESTNGFSSQKIRQIVAEQLAIAHPRHLRNWARLTSKWSGGTASLVAATYTRDLEGFKELIGSPFSDLLRKAQVISRFLEMLSVPQLPFWFREHAEHNADFFIPLLTLGGEIPPDVSHTIQKVLEEVKEIPIAKAVELVDKIYNLQQFSFGSKLIDIAMRSAIGGYIVGDIGLKTCETWQSTNWGAEWVEKVTKWELESLLLEKSSNGKKAWSRAWQWIAYAPKVLYGRFPPVLPKIIESLLVARRWDWDATITESWVEILRRAANEAKSSTHLQLCADALKFAFNHERYPLGNVVVEGFWRVYTAVTESPEIPAETRTLFGILDWDKGKELRKELVRSFLHSEWPPGDLALAIPDESLLRKIFKRLIRQREGERYITEMLKDLAGRQDPIARRNFSTLANLVQKPDFYEPWD